MLALNNNTRIHLYMYKNEIKKPVIIMATKQSLCIFSFINQLKQQSNILDARQKEHQYISLLIFPENPQVIHILLIALLFFHSKITAPNTTFLSYLVVVVFPSIFWLFQTFTVPSFEQVAKMECSSETRMRFTADLCS